MKLYGVKEIANLINSNGLIKISPKKINDILIEAGMVRTYREKDRNSGLLPGYKFKKEDYSLKYVSLNRNKKDFFILKFTDSGLERVLNFLNTVNFFKKN